MFTMLYVNDVGGVRGMTFVDWVFGGFLFIVGFSIPLAFANRLKRGESIGRLLLHVLQRTAGLLLLGVLMVNGEGGRPDAARLGYSRELWHLLLFTFGILAFLAPLKKSPAALRINIVIRCIGFAGLAYLAIVFRTKEGEWLSPQWWGILGLLGWAYLTAAVGYLTLRRREWLVAATFLLMGLFMFDHTNFFAKPWATAHLPWLHWLHKYINFSEMLGSQGAISMSGVVLGTMLLDPQWSPRQRVRGALLWGLLLAIAALLFYPFYLINKNNATPTWCFICAALTCWLWALLSLVIDSAGVVRPLKLFITGGQNVLFAYLFMDLLIYFIWWRGYGFYGEIGQYSLAAGITRSLVMAALVLWLAGFLKDRGGRLRL